MFSDGRKAHLDDIRAKVVAAGTTAAASAGIQGHLGGLEHCVTRAKLPPAAFSSGFEALETLRWNTARLGKLRLAKHFNPPVEKKKKEPSPKAAAAELSGTAGAGRAPGTALPGGFLLPSAPPRAQGCGHQPPRDSLKLIFPGGASPPGTWGSLRARSRGRSGDRGAWGGQSAAPPPPPSPRPGQSGATAASRPVPVSESPPCRSRAGIRGFPQQRRRRSRPPRGAASIPGPSASRGRIPLPPAPRRDGLGPGCAPAPAAPLKVTAARGSPGGRRCRSYLSRRAERSRRERGAAAVPPSPAAAPGDSGRAPRLLLRRGRCAALGGGGGSVRLSGEALRGGGQRLSPPREVPEPSGASPGGAGAPLSGERLLRSARLPQRSRGCADPPRARGMRGGAGTLRSLRAGEGGSGAPQPRLFSAPNV